MPFDGVQAFTAMYNIDKIMLAICKPNVKVIALIKLFHLCKSNLNDSILYRSGINITNITQT
jgi:hypothetical protein